MPEVGTLFSMEKPVPAGQFVLVSLIILTDVDSDPGLLTMLRLVYLSLELV